jgi:hypothetical protein
MTTMTWRELLGALADSNRMDYAAHYHRIGRRFGYLSDAQLNKTWVAAQRARYQWHSEPPPIWPGSLAN